MFSSCKTWWVIFYSGSMWQRATSNDSGMYKLLDGLFSVLDPSGKEPQVLTVVLQVTRWMSQLSSCCLYHAFWLAKERWHATNFQARAFLIDAVVHGWVRGKGLSLRNRRVSVYLSSVLYLSEKIPEFSSQHHFQEQPTKETHAM